MSLFISPSERVADIIFFVCVCVGFSYCFVRVCGVIYRSLFVTRYLCFCQITARQIWQVCFPVYCIIHNSFVFYCKLVSGELCRAVEGRER